MALDVEPGPVESRRSPIADAVEALMLTARVWRQRFGPEPIGPWERAQWLTGGVLSPAPTLPPALRPGRALPGHDLIADQL